MERIDKKYAIVYVDRTGESLADPQPGDGYTTKEIIDDFWKNSGFLQWNMYLIIAEENVEAGQKGEIEDNDLYVRKLVVPDKNIDAVIENLFPEMEGTMGKIILVKGKTRHDARTRAFNILLKMNEAGDNSFNATSGWYHDIDLMTSISNIDKMRAKLIKEKENVIFYTHLSDEFNIAEKKFKLFTDDENKT